MQHKRGDKKCEGCRPGYPVPCDEKDCTGLVHAERVCLISAECDTCPPEQLFGKDDGHDQY